jgi:hypothetical protein
MDYFNAVSKMESMGVNDNYIQGWIAGFLCNPELEEQRITEEYESGYSDGKARVDSNFTNFITVRL